MTDEIIGYGLCKACKGTGKLPDGKTCNTCGGTGDLPIYKEKRK
jgi:RecJ-like exonuclease